MAADSRGKLYAWGYSLAFGFSEVSGECLCLPTHITLEEEEEEDGGARGPTWVARVACGSRHSLAFTAAGACLVAGSNSGGQLGLGRDMVGQRISSFARLSVGGEEQPAARVLSGDGGTNSTILLAAGPQ